ncbi:hypothetical protein TBR22_A24090 [Luteitalea sp. TBR-22]|uniref:acyl-CoA reductase n=1 Tax=Luteitalea sp. TBR-22 TaxID=2802971 RepID=UPI001AF53565|nr:acyl-CoA reductase [Luteitalea sp. TBR-22]BCS33182.1 hypothetical protein TBR22_A24090 [Luteitalea sp. TBR-22]
MSVVQQGAAAQIREWTQALGPSRASSADRREALNQLSDDLLVNRAGIPPALAAAGVAFLATFLRHSSIEAALARELPSAEALDRFVPVGGRKSIRILPRGTVAQWIAGNVPLLAMFSWALASVTGNRSILRLSTRQDDFVTPLLARLAALSEAGAEMARETLVVSFEREDLEAHVAMSRAADVRVAWGGLEAVEAIRDLPARWETETIVLGPRVSLAVVDPREVTDRLLTRLAIDVIYFDQLACSSPQWLFVRGTRAEAEHFTERLAVEFDKQTRAIPRHVLDYGETYRIHLDRTRVLLDGGTLFRDEQTRWTVSVVDRPQDLVTCANRFLQVMPFDDFAQVHALIPENVQTAVTLLGPEDTETFTEGAARRGVCRFPRPGEGSHFETPWDGIPLVSRLTRWVLRTDAHARGEQ